MGVETSVHRVGKSYPSVSPFRLHQPGVKGMLEDR